MCEHSVLGPIDPQLGESPAAALIAVVDKKPIAEVDDRTLILADGGRQAIAQVKQAAAELLIRQLSAEQADALAEKLASGTWTYDYPIWASTAKSLRLPINTKMPDQSFNCRSFIRSQFAPRAEAASNICRCSVETDQRAI